MKYFRTIIGGGCLAIAAFAYACGGSTTGPADVTDAGADAAQDSSAPDAGSCTAYLTTTCDAGCPSGSICVHEAVVDTEVEHGCYPLPIECQAANACGCIASCVCSPQFVSDCSATSGNVVCQSGTVSRREFKKDIEYVNEEERASLAAQALHTSLAEYRYKTEPADAKKRLGFIIDDMPNPSPAIKNDRTHVDEYGYTSMLLATVQEQQKQIDDLKKAIADLSSRDRK